jgi:sec-independent protein translocase protein TatA
MRIGPLGVWEILIILVVILLVFGPRRLPEMAKGIGQSVREFRKGIRDIKDDIAKDDEPKKVSVVETPAPPPAQPTPYVAATPSEPVPETRREADEVKSA